MLRSLITHFALTLAAFVSMTGVAAAPSSQAGYRVVALQRTFIDESRPIKASMGFPGSPTRRLDVYIWYPTAAASSQSGQEAAVAAGGPWPLIVFSHGTFGRADGAMHILRELVSHGYVVAAANYPLTSSAAFTKIKGADLSDVRNQTRDISFIIDRVLADPLVGRAIDAKKIGTTGISLGAVTSYFQSFANELRDDRVIATAPIGAGDPVQTALSNDMGFAGTQHAAKAVPTLFVSASEDVFARTTGRPHAAYARIEKPKYEVMIKGGAHVWFGDGAAIPPNGKNPDCLFFERNLPGVTMPGCEIRAQLIDPARQKLITRAALLNFFDAYLKGDAGALDRLRQMDKQFGEVVLLREE